MLWLDALMDGTLTLHPYDDAKIKSDYFFLIVSLYEKFKGSLCTD